MNGFLKFALGVAVLGVVGLVGLSVLGIFIAVPMASYTIEVNNDLVESVPLPVTQVARIERGAHDTFNAPALVPHSVQTNWGAPAQVQVNVRDSWIEEAGSLVGFFVFIATLAILYIFIRSTRRGRVANTSDESALVHELARRAQDLSQRMEALETILLDRTRSPFHNEKVKQS